MAVRTDLRADLARLFAMKPAATPLLLPGFQAQPQANTPVVHTKAADMLPHHPREDALKAEFIKHVTLSDGKSVQSGRPIVKIWLVRNNGLTTWPNDTEVVFIEGLPGVETSLRVPALQPNEEGEVMCTLQPAADAISKSTWRLRSASVQNGKDGFFGPFLESNIIIGDTNDEDSLQSDNDDRLEAPSVIASSPNLSNKPFVFHAPASALPQSILFQSPPQPYYPAVFQQAPVFPESIARPENSLADGGVGPAPAKNIGLDRRSPTPKITFSREATPDPTPVTKKRANLVPAADLDWQHVCTKSDLQGLIYLFSTF